MSITIKKSFLLTAFSLVVVLLITGCQAPAEPKPGLTDQEMLGNALYFDTNLSNPPGQSCASCHDPAAGFADPDRDHPTSEGVNPGLFGNRNTPVSAYAMYTPARYFEEAGGVWVGGQFWDSRATGEVLGDPLADQAIGPFENPVEMANTREGVLQAIQSASYYLTQFVPVCGEINLGDPDAVDVSYHCAGLAIAAFERSGLFAQFSSKYDYYLQTCISEGGDMQDCATGNGSIAWDVGRKIFHMMEWHGMQIFMRENDNDGILEEGEGGMCSACHVVVWTAAEDYELNVVVPEWAPEGWIPPVFTDFNYENLGIPRNPENPFYSLAAEHNPDGTDFIDLGLGLVIEDEDENGKFRVVTLRNVQISSPYTHNGFFISTQELINFYNTRDVADFPEAEVPETVNVEELGNLGLSRHDEMGIVMFLNTLTDGYEP
jgi:cytochrome c peroxidase